MNEIKPYLTIPLLEACNFRCVYCPPEGCKPVTRNMVKLYRFISNILP